MGNTPCTSVKIGRITQVVNHIALLKHLSSPDVPTYKRLAVGWIDLPYGHLHIRGFVRGVYPSHFGGIRPEDLTHSFVNRWSPSHQQ
jgi:hypothetical protein